VTTGSGPQLGRLSLVAAAVLLFEACSSGAPCAHAAPAPSAAPSSSGCADLRLRGQLYDEWRTIDPPRPLQEVGDATYPACNLAGSCGGDPARGHASTDVWHLRGVGLARAVIGFREGTGTYVIFVRRGVDPTTLDVR
jgi:hypothetical protein